MAVKHLIGRRLACGPDRDMCIAARSDDTAVFEPGHRIHRAVMKAHHLLGDVARQRPANRRGVEAARDHVLAVGGNCQRAYRSAVATQLRANAVAAGSQAGKQRRGAQCAKDQGAARSEPKRNHSLCIITHKARLDHGIQNGFTVSKSRWYGSTPMSFKLRSLRLSSVAPRRCRFQRPKQTAIKSEKRERPSAKMVMAHLHLSH